MKQALLHNPVLQGQAKSNSFRSCKRVGSSWSAATQKAACAQDRTAQGLTSRKDAERSLTCCAPRKGVKVGGTHPLPSTGRHLAVREMGIPKQQKNRARSFPFSCQLYIGLLGKGLTVKELVSPKSLANSNASPDPALTPFLAPWTYSRENLTWSSLPERLE